MSTITLPLGASTIDVPLPDSWEVVGRVEPVERPGLGDLAAALRAALASPIGCAPMAAGELAGKKIAIVVDDVTRPTPLRRYFGDIVSWLEGLGARRDDMLVVNALGVHRDMTEAETMDRVGREALAGIRWVNSRPRDPDANVDLGTTSRGTRVRLLRDMAGVDLIVCAGAIEPHLLLGFGGGLKMIIPGCAHETTIAANHMQGVSPGMFNYIGAMESPMRLDLEEGALRLGKRFFIVNAVMNSRLEVHAFVAGDPIKAHRAGVAIAESMYARPVEGPPVDVAIVSSDPMNADLRQGMKSIGNVERCVREGGMILALLDCRSGIGDIAMPPKALPNGLLRLILRTIGRKRVLWFIDSVKKGAGVEERFMAHFSMQIVRKNRIMAWSPNLPPDTGKRLGLFVQHGDVGGMMDQARKAAPARARVLVFPHGGVTYPVPGPALPSPLR